MAQDFPTDCIIDILSRLPPKSLHRFRCVCRSWLSLLCPHFIRFHSNTKNLFMLFEKHYSILDCYEATSSSDVNSAMVTVKYPFPRITTYFDNFPFLVYYNKILASCDSWLLLSVPFGENSELMILNPFTGDYKKISCVTFSREDSFGICYDRSDNDYKLMQVSETEDFSTSFNVFSFKTSSWTKVREMTNWIPGFNTTHAFSVNGAMHLTFYCRPDDRYVISSFDLKGELKEVPQPDHQLMNGYFSLASARGNLWIHGYISGRYEMFEMKQYGLKESWTQVCSIKTCAMAKTYQPLAFTKKGDLIIGYKGKELLVYHLEQDELKTLMKFKGSIAPCPDSSITLSCDCLHQRESNNTTYKVKRRRNNQKSS